jgi:hypothetical protein
MTIGFPQDALFTTSTQVSPRDDFEESRPWGNGYYNDLECMGGDNLDVFNWRLDGPNPASYGENYNDELLAGLTGDNIDNYMEDELPSIDRVAFNAVMTAKTEHAFGTSDGDCPIVEDCFNTFFHRRPTTQEQAAHINKTDPVHTWELLVWLTEYVSTSGLSPKEVQIDMLEIIEGLLDVEW